MILQFLISELVERLVLTERIESVILLTYLALIAMAYFSPNAELILGIKLTSVRPKEQKLVSAKTEYSATLAETFGRIFGRK